MGVASRQRWVGGSRIAVVALAQLGGGERERPTGRSSDDRTRPGDSGVPIKKVEDGRGHLAGAAKQTMDAKTGVVVGLAIHGGDGGDKSMVEALSGAAV